MSLDDYTTERRRLALLAVLFFASAYRLPLRALRDQAAGLGYDASLDRVRSDVAWLAEQGLAVIAGNAAILTDRGADVVHGRSHQPGVTRPAPGEVEDFRRILVGAGIHAAQAALRGE